MKRFKLEEIMVNQQLKQLKMGNLDATCQLGESILDPIL